MSSCLQDVRFCVQASGVARVQVCSGHISIPDVIVGFSGSPLNFRGGLHTRANVSIVRIVPTTSFLRLPGMECPDT